MYKKLLLVSLVIGVVIAVGGFVINNMLIRDGHNLMAIGALWVAVGILVARGIYVVNTPQPMDTSSSL